MSLLVGLWDYEIDFNKCIRANLGQMESPSHEDFSTKDNLICGKDLWKAVHCHYDN